MLSRPAAQRSPHPRRKKRQKDDGRSDHVVDHGWRPERHSDPQSGDDATACLLPVFVRFRDIRAAGIATSWTQLNKLIDEDGFPIGVMLSPNIRAWRVNEIEAWLATRPTERKGVPDRWERK
jgi:predicted DNA-binding transcriptional regulator AlpA